MALLLVVLTDAEKQAKAMELAVVCDQIRGLEQDRRETVAELNVDIKSKKHIQEKLTREVRTGKEEREVATKEVIDWDHNLVRELRVDTGEEIGARVLTAAERQRPLAIGEGRDAEEA